MITREELQRLLISTETYRVEKTTSTTNMDKFCEAICAFANDMPNSGGRGYLLIGVKDDGIPSGLSVTNELMVNISAIRSDGNILPLPTMNVESFSLENGDVLVIEVIPSEFTSVRYRGRTHIRIGPRKDIATIQEERILAERVSANYPSFDTTPCCEASIDDINTTLFTNEYLPKAISEDQAETKQNYPQWAIRELLMKSVMHRDYRSNTPTKFYQYIDKLEITNAGGLYGNARPDNSPTVNDYRNPIIAEALKVLGYVNKFNKGIARVQFELMEKGNDKAEFTIDKITVFQAKVNIATNIATSEIEQIEADKTTPLERKNHDEKALLTLTKLSAVGPSSKELFESLNITNQTYSYRILDQLKENKLIVSTSDKPTSPNQKYAITEIGRSYLYYKRV